MTRSRREWKILIFPLLINVLVFRAACVSEFCKTPSLVVSKLQYADTDEGVDVVEATSMVVTGVQKVWLFIILLENLRLQLWIVEDTRSTLISKRIWGCVAEKMYLGKIYRMFEIKIEKERVLQVRIRNWRDDMETTLILDNKNWIVKVAQAAEIMFLSHSKWQLYLHSHQTRPMLLSKFLATFLWLFCLCPCTLWYFHITTKTSIRWCKQFVREKVLEILLVVFGTYWK